MTEEEPRLLTRDEWEAEKEREEAEEQARLDALAWESARQSGQLYELRIIATGEVRDADGKLLNTTTLDTEPVTVTEAEALELLERQAQQ